VYVSHHYVATLWRENGLKPHRAGTFKVSKDPAFAEKVTDIVGLYVDPPGGAVALSMDDKTQIQALGQTQPMLPIAFDATEKRTHDYIRHGTTNLFAALHVGTGEVFGECKPPRDGENFLAFLKKPSNGMPVEAFMRCWATCPRTPPRTCAPGWRRIRTSTFNSLRSGYPGLIRSKLGLASSLASPSVGAPSVVSKS
jgi:hypothetical protein